MIDLSLDVDEIWKGLGPWGRYQRFQIFLLFMDGMACAFHLLSTVMIGFRHPYQCREIETNCTTVDTNCGNYSLYVEYGNCDMDIYRNDTNLTFIKSQHCRNGYNYPVSKDRTFVTEWDLVCENASYAEFTQTLVIIGQATGAAIFTQFSDRFGRKPVHILSHLGFFVVALVMAFVPNYTMFAVLRYLVGTFQQGIVMTNAVMVLEILPRKSRFKAHIPDITAWTTGIALIAPLGYLFRNLSWRYLQMALALYSSYSLCSCWIVDSLTYFGIALNSYTLSGNRFLNFFFIALMDYPAVITELFLIKRIGRKRTVIFFHAVAGVSCITATVFMTLADGNNSMLVASTVFTLLGKYGSAGSFSIIFLYTPELYPTNLRNAGLGVSSSISRAGGMLAPFAGPLSERIKWAPGTIFGSMCLLVTILCIRLPETTKYKLPQTLEEMENWLKSSKTRTKM